MDLELKSTPVFRACPAPGAADAPPPCLSVTVTLTAGGDDEAASLGRLARAIDRRIGRPDGPAAVVADLLAAVPAAT